MKSSYSKFVENKINQYLLARRLARRSQEIKTLPARPGLLLDKLAGRLAASNPQPAP